jgi:hypothetical protein
VLYDESLYICTPLLGLQPSMWRMKPQLIRNILINNYPLHVHYFCYTVLLHASFIYARYAPFSFPTLFFWDSGRRSAPSAFVMRHHNTSIDRLTLLLYGASRVGHQSPTSINANMFMEELILKLVELRTTISRQLLTHDSIIQDIDCC